MNLVLMFACFLVQDRDIELNDAMRVEFVTLDVSAFDKRGRPVTDLALSDFSVTEDGRPVEIGYFEKLSFENPAKGEDLEPATPGLSEGSAETQQLVLALDVTETSVMDAKRSFFHLRRLVESLDRRIDYRINLYSLDRGSLTRGFETDADRVLSLLKDYEEGHFRGRERRLEGPSEPVLLGDGGLFDNHREDPYKKYSSRDVFDLEDLEEELRNCYGQADCVSRILEVYLDQQYFRTLKVFRSLETLAYDFDGQPGLKIMLLVSPGFALTQLNSAIELAQLYSKSSLWGINNQFDIEQRALQRDFQRVIHACIKNRVVFHTFDIYNAGLDWDRTFTLEPRPGSNPVIGRIFRGFMHDISDGLRELAEQSGGTFFQSKDLVSSAEKVLDRSKFYYVVGYASPAAGAPGRYRKIKVQCGRRGVKLRYRHGYFGG